MSSDRPLARLFLVLAVLLQMGCCGLVFRNVDDKGLSIAEEPTGLRYTLDEIRALKLDGQLYNPEKAQFALPPRLSAEPYRVVLAGVAEVKAEPRKAIPKEAKLRGRSVDLGWAGGPVRRSSRSKTAPLMLDPEAGFHQKSQSGKGDAPPHASTARPVTVTITVTRLSLPVQMFNLRYEEAALPWRGALPKGIRGSPGTYLDPDSRWIARQGPLRPLRRMDQTKSVRIEAFITTEQVKASGFSCNIKLGRAIHRASTPIFGELYHELRGLEWSGPKATANSSLRPKRERR